MSVQASQREVEKLIDMAVAPPTADIAITLITEGEPGLGSVPKILLNLFTMFLPWQILGQSEAIWNYYIRITLRLKITI